MLFAPFALIPPILLQVPHLPVFPTNTAFSVFVPGVGLFFCLFVCVSFTPPPPWSACGFKVLILIGFELTYCQSSFSCSSETIWSYDQDLDLGSWPTGLTYSQWWQLEYK